MTPLHNTPQWIVVLLVPLPNGKTDKLPVDYRTATVGVNAHDPQFWTTHAAAADLAGKWGGINAQTGGGFTVGFVLTENDPYFCLDIDNALQPDGQWSPLSQQLCAALPNCTIEVSQSGRGLHVWGIGPVPPHSKKNIPLAIELYTERRFIAIGRPGAVGEMTGPCPTIAAVAANYFPPRETVATHGDGPDPSWRGPESDDELIRRALQSRSARSAFGGGASFADLWERNVEVLARAYPPDASSTEPYDGSSADAGLAQHLAFWTGRDAERIGRLMRQSGLRRDKHDRDDYMARTTANACAMQREVLQDRPVQPSGLPEMPTEVHAAPVENSRTGEVSADTGGAPSMTDITGSTFLSPAEQRVLFRGCVYIVDQHRALVPGGHLVNAERFRAIFGGYTFAMDARNERTTRNAWEAFTESQVLKAPRADGTCFRPDLTYGTLVQDAGRLRANTWWPVSVPRKKGDVTPLLNHLAKLLPNFLDRQYLLYYMAAVLQHPGVKFQWAPVIQGVEGNGKTLLSRCVAEGIGRRYCFWPKASKLAKQFNGWMVGRVFFAVEDIHTSEHVDVIEELKPMITGGDGLEIEAKGVDQISAEICGNFIFNTNHKNGLRKTRNDRRFAVFYCAQQTVDDLARDGMDGDYMRRMYDWLKTEDGYAIVAEYLLTLEIPDEFNPAKGLQRAPRTSSTDEAIAQSYGRVEQEALEAIEQELPGFAGGWISSIQFDKLIDRMGRGWVVPPNRRRDLLRSLGYDWHPALPAGRVHNVVLPDGAKPRLYVRNGHAALALTSAAEIARSYSVAQGVK